jgi:mRNA interferase HigB
MNWLDIVRRADWANLMELRKAFPHADAVEVRSGHTATVFNIRGNRYRLIVAIKYQWRMVYVLRFLTHREYDTDKWKGNYENRRSQPGVRSLHGIDPPVSTATHSQ